MKDNPDTPIIEIDSIDGVKCGEVLLTLHTPIKVSMFIFSWTRSLTHSFI